MTGFKHIWLDEYMPRLQMFVPKLVFADSALWMWLEHVCMWDPYPHSMLDCGGRWPKQPKVQRMREAYFKTDPMTDYNN